MSHIFVITWSVHYDKAHILDRKNLFILLNGIYKEQKEVIFPSGNFIFARILFFFFFLCPKMRLRCEYLRILLLIRSGDIETNPGPMKQSCLKFFHWNLNGLAAHDFIKLTLIEAYIASNNFDIVCLSETFLDSSISNDDSRIKIAGYSLLRVDHSSNTKKGGVCICYKDFLPLIKRIT